MEALLPSRQMSRSHNHMTEADVINIFQQTIWTIFLVSGPAVMTALVVGVVIAFIQAITQVQEMTLTFVPKVIGIFVTLVLFSNFIGNTLFSFTERMFHFIEKGF